MLKQYSYKFFYTEKYYIKELSFCIAFNARKSLFYTFNYIQ